MIIDQALPEIRVAVLNRDRNSHPGGDVVHIDLLTDYLVHLRVRRDYLNNPSPETLRNYDLIHIHHVNFGWSRDNLEIAVRSGIPFVVTAIYYPEDWGMSKGEILTMCQLAETVVCFSPAEADELKSDVGFQGRVEVVPPGVEERFHCSLPSQHRTGVCAVAARDNDKNADLVERVCGKLHIPFKLLTGIPHNELHEEYKKFRVFVNASGSERFGLTILEGLAAGCRVVATKYSRGIGWFPGIVRIDPYNFDDAAEKTAKAYFLAPGKWDMRPNERARGMTWEKSAGAWRRVYDEVLAKSG